MLCKSIDWFLYESNTGTKLVKLLLSSLDISKTTGRYRIPTKVLKLLENDISDQIANLFNLSFTTGSFPTLVKAAKVISMHKNSQN